MNAQKGGYEMLVDIVAAPVIPGRFLVVYIWLCLFTHYLKSQNSWNLINEATLDNEIIYNFAQG